MILLHYGPKRPRRGPCFYLTGKYQKAIVEYEKALVIFQQIGHDVDYARHHQRRAAKPDL